MKKIVDPRDDEIIDCLYLWALKPNCSLIKLEPKLGEENMFSFEITDNVQKQFDFMDITFNPQEEGLFICDRDKKIGRELNKAILFRKNIPFLAPEVILYIISNPAYIESDYHRDKNNIDFASVPPFLSKESMEWLIAAIELAYPNGNHRLAQLKLLQQTL